MLFLKIPEKYKINKRINLNNFIVKLILESYNKSTQ